MTPARGIDRPTPDHEGDRNRLGGFELELRSIPGAVATRVVHRAAQEIETHRHDGACIIVPVLGATIEECDAGETLLEGAAAVLRPGGTEHSDAVGDEDAEGISILFDPAWLRLNGFESRIHRTMAVHGGKAGAAGRRIAGLWANAGTPEQVLAEETARFIVMLASEPNEPQPAWFDHVSRAVDPVNPTRTCRVADQLGLHPAWLARAYRAAAGEGLHETLRRRRVQRAVSYLRSSQLPLAQVAVASGFCDQSHMNRNFRALLGRSPLQVRREGDRTGHVGAKLSAH